MGAGRPPILTCTWSSEVGNGLVATTVSAARFELLENVSSSPGAIPAVNGAQLAALTIPCGFRNTPVRVRVGACKATLSPRFGPMPEPIRIAPPAPTPQRPKQGLVVSPAHRRKHTIIHAH